MTLGIVLAFVTMFGWGFGDFLIQKSARKMGDWETLFFITFFGTIVLLPFSFHRFYTLFASGGGLEVFILPACGAGIFIAAILQFQGVKIGKLAVIEPLWSIEIISAAFFAYLFLKESLSLSQIFLITVLILSFFLLSIRDKKSVKFRQFFVERGVIIAVIGTIVLGGADFLMGWGSRITDPILVNFTANLVMALITGTYILFNGRMGILVKDVIENPKLLVAMSIADNTAWVTYALAMSLASIGVITALSESCVIIAVLLGLFINKEKLQRHQKVGLAGALVSAIVLAVITT